MINRARLVQCLPWQCLNRSSIEPDREAIASAIAGWLDRDLIAADGTLKRRKPSELAESLEAARAALKTFRRHLRAAGLQDHALSIFDAAGAVRHATYQSLLIRMEQDLALKKPAPHPAANDNPDQWQRLVMRGIFWNLQDAGLVDWSSIFDRDQARFLSAILAEAASLQQLPSKPWSAGRWRKSRDDFFTATPTGYHPNTPA